MKNIINYLRHRHDTALLGASFILLILAMINPTLPLPHNIYNYLLVADISQSMNTVDTTIDNKPASRMAYTQYMMRNVISTLPCGTKVSIGLFVGASIAALYTPIEVCKNYSSIEDTIDHLDWRSGWSGNSRLRESMLSIAKTIRGFPEPAQVVFFTDGEEAPRLHVFNTRDLSNFQGGDGWLLVGIGSSKGTPIPKLDEYNQLIGYWAGDSFALQPGIAQISEANIGTRNDSVANSESDRYLSKLDEEYLKSLAKEVHGQYVRGDNIQNLSSAMSTQKPARRAVAPYDLQLILASLAGLILIIAYLPKHPANELRIFLTKWKSKAS